MKKNNVIDDTNPNFNYLTVKDADGNDLQNVVSFNPKTQEIGICPVVFKDSRVSDAVFMETVAATDKKGLTPIAQCVLKGAFLAHKYTGSRVRPEQIERILMGEKLYSI